MSKPEDIPQDVWDAATEAFDQILPFNSHPVTGITIIARAIMAAKAEEREACLNEISILAGTPLQPQSALAHAYSAIRKRGEPQ